MSQKLLAVFLAAALLLAACGASAQPAAQQPIAAGAQGPQLFALNCGECHAADVHRLIEVLQKFVDEGHTVVIIEHQPDIIKVADHIIDLGPEGGDKGGYLVAEGTPEEVAKVKGSYTGRFLGRVLGG